MNLLFPIAFAQESAQTSQPSLIYNLFLFGGMIVLFYLILWRPQAKKNKEHKELVSSISKGDEVMTAGGILGKVTKIGDEYIAVEIAKNTEIKLQRSSILAALPKGTIAQI
ncbi:MAG: preprotein translocase subunit YajC [Gammaproteobacteria bacterium]|nr:preprotein translocase subunit YajC [Gammaproteobacteria bacterium]MCY4356633.1 preprotein translocase subunit YajC [Gammaproteobacteria bacterium]